jgi:hypothetical protein
LMHHRDHCDEDCEMTKANYLTQICAATLAEGCGPPYGTAYAAAGAR